MHLPVRQVGVHDQANDVVDYPALQLVRLPSPSLKLQASVLLAHVVLLFCSSSLYSSCVRVMPAVKCAD
eukprot:6214357-Pleurochrysis_carterae.AAC.12